MVKAMFYLDLYFQLQFILSVVDKCSPSLFIKYSAAKTFCDISPVSLFFFTRSVHLLYCLTNCSNNKKYKCDTQYTNKFDSNTNYYCSSSTSWMELCIKVPHAVGMKERHAFSIFSKKVHALSIHMTCSLPCTP